MDWKKLAKKLLFPPLWLMVILVIASAVALSFIFIRGLQESIPAYIVYVLAFYTLSVVTLYCVTVLPKQYSTIKQKIYNNPLGNRYMTDSAFREKTGLRLSLVISLLYVAVNVWSWYLSRSWWFVVLSVYYVIMALLRLLLVGNVRNGWKRARLCACILLLINLSLSGAVLMILYQHRGYDYPGILIYVMALYTFYSTTHAIIELVRYRRKATPVMAAARVVSLSAALVSMLNLETAMFAQFGGEMSVAHQHLFIILTGAGISAAVITLATILIVRANQNIRRENHGT